MRPPSDKALAAMHDVTAISTLQEVICRYIDRLTMRIDDLDPNAHRDEDGSLYWFMLEHVVSDIEYLDKSIGKFRQELAALSQQDALKLMAKEGKSEGERDGARRALRRKNADNGSKPQRSFDLHRAIFLHNQLGGHVPLMTCLIAVKKARKRPIALLPQSTEGST